MSTSKGKDIERYQMKERLITYLKDLKRYSYNDESSSKEKSEDTEKEEPNKIVLSDIHLVKTRAIKQWYLKAADFADLPSITKSKKSVVYSLDHILRKSDKRNGTANLYEMVFDSKEAFQMVSKKEASEDEYFHKYKKNKRKILTVYLLEKVVNYATEISEKYGPETVEEAQAEFLQAQEDSIKVLKAKWKEYEMEYDHLEDMFVHVKSEEIKNKLGSKFFEIFTLQMELSELEKSVKRMKEIMAPVLLVHEDKKRKRTENMDGKKSVQKKQEIVA